MMKEYALISIYDKKNINKICQLFKEYNIGIIATGSTEKYIKKIGYRCNNVSKYTNFKEILNGRVKTIHPLIHASLLFNREDTAQTKFLKN